MGGIIPSLDNLPDVYDQFIIKSLKSFIYRQQRGDEGSGTAEHTEGVSSGRDTEKRMTRRNEEREKEETDIEKKITERENIMITDIFHAGDRQRK